MANEVIVSLSDVKSFFRKELSTEFSSSEANIMFKMLACRFYNWHDSNYILNTNLVIQRDFLNYVRQVMEQLKNNIPFQYIYGSVEFYGLEILVDNSVLIPRPETEELVDWILENNNSSSFLDICSGSGCIALALKSKRINSKVIGFDISEEAINLARKNAKSLELDVVFLKKDVFGTISMNEQFDLIVSNPPYIPTMEINEMTECVLKHEPHLALFVPNEDPLVFYKRIMGLSSKLLKSYGLIFFECNPNYINQVAEDLQKYDLIFIEKKKDLQGKWRFLKAQKK